MTDIKIENLHGSTTIRWNMAMSLGSWIGYIRLSTTMSMTGFIPNSGNSLDNVEGKFGE